MSPRAAWRLEQLGFATVYDFVQGKSFWIAHGLPTEHKIPADARVGPAAERNVPVCLLGDTIATAMERIAHQPDWDLCIVTNAEGVVAGRLRLPTSGADHDDPVDDSMEPGPTTVRPDANLADVTRRMSERNVDSIIVTDPGGRLIGVLRAPETATHER